MVINKSLITDLQNGIVGIYNANGSKSDLDRVLYAAFPLSASPNLGKALYFYRDMSLSQLEWAYSDATYEGKHKFKWVRLDMFLKSDEPIYELWH